jgi:2-keto-4-pentenoate hydratase/2-oxohepta-3-ene-1,7-dioic acid hydratase in catechol pathway
MHIGNFYNPEENLFFYGIVENNVVYSIKNFEKLEKVKEYPLEKLKIQPASFPSKIVAVGLNYRDHAEEMKLKIPDEPVIFLKPPSSILAHREKIIYPDMTKQVDYEAELAIIIKSVTRNVTVKEAYKYILGFTAFNDVTARDLQKKDGQWTRAKSFDTFAPFGPFINTDLDPSNLRIQAILNGQVKQDSNTSNMIFDVYKLVSFISRIMTLYPGDVIATGTPSGIGPMNRGDRIVIKIELLHELENYVG